MILRGGNVFFSEVFEMDDEYIIYRKVFLFYAESFSVTIPIQNIRSIELRRKINGVSIIIKSVDGNKIIGRYFSKKSFDKIKNMIEN